MIESLASSSPKQVIACPTRRKRAVIIFDNFGPYHLARLRAAAKVCDLKAIQIAGRSAVYAWDNEAPPEGMNFATLFTVGASHEIGKNELARRMEESLDEFSPEMVLIPGWSGVGAIDALAWCVRRRVPAVIMSESTEWDERRTPMKEWVKRKIIGLCSAALVGGQPHKDYLVKLGMAPESVFFGYDAVDNDYFIGKTDGVRTHLSQIRASYGLPENYFLASARFVEKKNLLTLIRAYSRYREYCELAAYREAKIRDALNPHADKLAGRQQDSGLLSSDPWSLVLVGDGPLRPELERLVSELHLQDFVHLPGFKQYPDLPAYYGCARAFVHASTTEQWGLVVNEAMASGLPVLVSNRCGCANDLVQDGINGFAFDPYNTEQLAQLMLRVSAPEFPLSTFGRASRRIISEWGPERFATGMLAAGAVGRRSFGKISTLSSQVFLEIAARALKRAPAQKPIELPEQGIVKRLLVFHFGARKILAIPAKSRELRRIGVQCYKAHTFKRRIYHRLISEAVFFGAPGFFSSAITANDSTTIGIDYERWVAMLENRLGKTNLQAVLAWPSQMDRERVYITLFDKQLQNCAFVKIAKMEEQALIEAGFNALDQLKTCQFQQFRLPHPMGCGIFDGRCFAIQEPLPTTAQSLNWRQRLDVSLLAQGLCIGRKRLSAKEIMQLSWWKRYAANLPADCEEFHRELMTQMERSGAEVGRVHGDFGLANMAVDGDTIWLFDWEFSHPLGPVLTDVVGFFLSFSVGKATKSPVHCAQEVSEQFLKKSGPEWHLNVMLALAFRHASGLPDAEVYIRRCSWNGTN